MKKKHQFLEKVEHFIEEPPHEPEPPKPEKPVSQRTRNLALLRYLGIMMTVAFLLVGLSLLQQQRNSQETITQLNQNASSALSRAEQLQDDNRSLTQQNLELKDQVTTLEDQLQALQAQLDTANAGAEALEQTARELEEALQAAKEDQSAMLQAYELLLEAQQALDQERTADFTVAMTRLADMEDQLNPQGMALYRELQAAGQRP